MCAAGRAAAAGYHHAVDLRTDTAAHRFVLVSDDHTFTVVHHPSSSLDATLDVQQALVDGYIEFVDGQVATGDGVRPLSVWVNEEGRLRPDLRPNHALGVLTPQRASPVVGAALVTSTDMHGDTVGLTGDQLDAVCAALAEAGARQLEDSDTDTATRRQRDIYQKRPQHEQ